MEPFKTVSFGKGPIPAPNLGEFLLIDSGLDGIAILAAEEWACRNRSGWVWEGISLDNFLLQLSAGDYADSWQVLRRNT